MGARTYHLRWEQPITLWAWANVDMSNDATLGYADRFGVLCGTCHEHTAFDPMAQELLSLRLRLLIAMEGTTLSPQYLGLVIGEAFEKFESLKERCQKIEGQFVLLWNNSEFLFEENRNTYSELLE